MPHLSRAQIAACQQIARLQDPIVQPEELGQRLLAAIDTAIPSDAQMLLGVDPSSLLFNRLLAVSTGSTDHTLGWLEGVYLAKEPITGVTFPSLMSVHYSALVLHDRIETSWGARPDLFADLTTTQWRRAYHDIGTPAGGVLRANFIADGEWIAALQLLRFEAGSTFRPSDVDFLRRLAPAIGRVLRCGFNHERAACAETMPASNAFGIILLDSNGQVRFRNPAAEAWIQLLRDTWFPETRGKVRLPTAVWSAVQRLRSAPDELIERGVLVPTSAGLLRVEASAGGEDGSVAVVLMLQQPSAPVELPSTWPLTRQERSVLTLLARGYTNRRIASTLAVSENTVETHLAHIYDKLGVHSKIELLARFFHESYWPKLNRFSTEDQARRRDETS